MHPLREQTSHRMTTLDWVTIASTPDSSPASHGGRSRGAEIPLTITFSPARDLGWVVVGASLRVQHRIGAPRGLAGAGATSGVALAHSSCMRGACWSSAGSGAVLLRSRVYTMPEFLELRFSATSRWVLSLISLVAYV